MSAPPNNLFLKGSELSASPSSNSMKSTKSINYFASMERRSQSPSPYSNLTHTPNYSSNEAIDCTVEENQTECAEEGGEEMNLGLTEKLLEVISQRDIDDIKEIQNDIVEDVGETVEKCQVFEKYSVEQFEVLSKNFEQHTKTIVELQRDLENVFRRIRSLKVKLKDKYPEQFQKVLQTLPDVEVEDD